MANTTTTTYRIPVDLRARVAERAERDGITATDVVIEAFERYADGIMSTPRRRTGPGRPAAAAADSG